MPTYLEKVPNSPSWLKRYKTNKSKFVIIVKRKRWGGKRQYLAVPEEITNKTAAEEYGEKKIAEWSGTIEKPVEFARVETLIDEVVENARADYESGTGAWKTLSKYEVAAKHVKPWFNENCPYVQDLSELVIDEDYVRAQRKKRPGAYLGCEIQLLRKVIKRAAQKKLITRFSIKTIDEKSFDESRGQFIPFEVQDQLLFEGRAEMRMKSALGCLGMRNKEKRTLELPQIDQKAGVIKLRKEQSKTRRARLIYLSPFVDAMLDLYIPTLPKGATCLFPSRTDPTRPVGDQKKAWRTHKLLAEKSINERRAELAGPDAEIAQLDVADAYREHDWRATALTVWGLLGIPYAVVGLHAGVSSKVYEERYLKVPAMSQEDLENLQQGIAERIDRFVPVAWRNFIHADWFRRKKIGAKLGQRTNSEESFTYENAS